MTHRQYKNNGLLKGEITVFLSLLSALFLGMICALTESVRSQMIRMNTEGVMDASLRSCFGEYDQRLYKRYDLLYIDSSYRGAETGGIDSVIAHLIRYMNENTDYSDTGAAGDWYGQNPEDASALSWVFASDEGGKPLKRQAVEYMEKYGKISYMDAVNSGKGSVKRGKKSNFFDEWDSILESIDAYGLPLTNPGKIVRGMVLSEDEFLKGGLTGRAMYGDRPSARGLKQGAGTSKLKRKNEDDDLFTEYLMQKCGCYTEFYPEQKLTAELEYIVYGESTDRDNMVCAVKELMDIRLCDNLRCIKGDGGRMAAAYARAYEIVMYNTLEPPPPVLVKLVRDSIVYAWAYGESAMDVSRLLNKGKCRIIKSSSDVELSLEDIVNFRSGLFGSGGEGFSYKELMGMFVSLTDDETRRMRCMDIVEGNCREFYNSGFRIDGCVEYLRAKASLASGYGYEHTIEREYLYE